MKISVVMATYNGKKFLKEQMESIYIQTLKPDEVYFSDDGSIDDTISIIQSFIDRYQLTDQWKIHVNLQNKGYAKNFLDASLQVEGDVIFFADQDDIWIPDRIEIMADIMEKHKEINLLCSNLEPFYENKDTRKWSRSDLVQMKNDGSLERHAMTVSDFHLKRSGCTMCIRKAYLQEVLPYWKEGWAHDDFVWKMSVTSNTCAIIQYCSMKRRMHFNNASVVRLRTREWRLRQFDNLLQQYYSLKEYAQNIGSNSS